jgi:ParB-like chromosome segregation protein Spo0J
MQFRTMKLSDLIPANYNPRKALQYGDREYEKLRRSIEEFGLVDPLVWNVRTGRLVGGHQRLTVMLDLGWTEGDVSVVDLPEDKEKALNIALNKVTGNWDYLKLTDLLKEMDVNILELTGWDEQELKHLLSRQGDSIPEENKMIDEIGMAETKNECPSCGFRY